MKAVRPLLRIYFSHFLFFKWLVVKPVSYEETRLAIEIKYRLTKRLEQWPRVPFAVPAHNPENPHARRLVAAGASEEDLLYAIGMAPDILGRLDTIKGYIVLTGSSKVEDRKRP